MNKQAIVVGWINHRKKADCGETMKNQLIINRLIELGWSVYPMDFHLWRKHPWVFLQLFWTMLLHPNALLILSSSAQNIYPFIKLLYKVKSKRKILHWVIGGNLHDKIKDGTYSAKYFKWLTANFVESPKIYNALAEMGFDNVKVVPNFKPINYIPVCTKFKDSKIHFVFMSRIKPEKGCDYIIDAAKILNDEGLGEKFEIDFYGKIEQNYQVSFMNKIKDISNVNYKGFLDFSSNESYDILARYNAMLFPTYWRGEGFAGIFIDAYISGTPILASDWGHNKYLLDAETAIFYPPKDLFALLNVMRNCILMRYDLDTMAVKCQIHACDFDVRKIIGQDLLEI